jgi:hypothetical protein
MLKIAYIKQKTLSVRQSFFGTLCTLDLSGTKATGANCNSSVTTVNYRFNLTDVRLPGSVCLTVRVRHVVSESNALTAYATLSHFSTSQIPYKCMSHYIFFVVDKSSSSSISDSKQKSKSFLKKIKKNIKPYRFY